MRFNDLRNKIPVREPVVIALFAGWSLGLIVGGTIGLEIMAIMTSVALTMMIIAALIWYIQGRGVTTAAIPALIFGWAIGLLLEALVGLDSLIQRALSTSVVVGIYTLVICIIFAVVRD